jgi:ABC-type glutathione transport system ATPase component
MTISTQLLSAVATTDLVKVYGSGDTAVRALDGVTAAFAQGQFTAIMGPSGSGKSTLMHCLAGLDAATAGSVRIGGTELSGRGAEHPASPRPGGHQTGPSLRPGHGARAQLRHERPDHAVRAVRPARALRADQRLRRPARRDQPARRAARTSVVGVMADH